MEPELHVEHDIAIDVPSDRAILIYIEPLELSWLPPPRRSTPSATTSSSDRLGEWASGCPMMQRWSADRPHRRIVGLQHRA